MGTTNLAVGLDPQDTTEERAVFLGHSGKVRSFDLVCKHVGFRLPAFGCSNFLLTPHGSQLPWALPVGQVMIEVVPEELERAQEGGTWHVDQGTKAAPLVEF